MKVIILAADYDARFYPLTKDIAKPLLPIRGKPVIEYTLNKVQLLEEAEEVFIVANDHFFKHYEKWLDNFPCRIPVKLINNGLKTRKDSLGAVGDLSLAIESQKLDDDLLIIGGDNLFSFSLGEFIRYSLSKRPSPLIGICDLNGRYRSHRYGVVKLNEQNRVIDFYEKAPYFKGQHLVSMCLYYFPKETLSLLNNYINPDKDIIRPKETPSTPEGRDTRYAIRKDINSLGNYIIWLTKRSIVCAYEFHGGWFDIGDIDSYTEAVCSF